MTGRRLALAFAVGEDDGERRAEPRTSPASEEEIVALIKETFDAREVEERDAMSMDMNKLMQQAQQMQAQMAKAQEELANETVEASAGGGMVTVKATGAGEIVEIKIDPKAIDPDDPELLEDIVLAAVNEALRSAQGLAQSKLGGALGGLAARPAGAVSCRDRRALRRRTRASPGASDATCAPAGVATEARLPAVHFAAGRTPAAARSADRVRLVLRAPKVTRPAVVATARRSCRGRRTRRRSAPTSAHVLAHFARELVATSPDVVIIETSCHRTASDVGRRGVAAQWRRVQPGRREPRRAADAPARRRHSARRSGSRSTSSACRRTRRSRSPRRSTR